MHFRPHIFRISILLFAVLVSSAFLRSAFAENAAFDLIGPKVEVRVQREGQTLPISQVPNLQAGDRLWVHPNLPDSQSVHYLMVVIFLRGATNPPPDSWFTRVEAWSKSVHEEGVFVVVPDGAEDALVLLAPDTGGAFSTLKNAVRGKPGAFVRAAQDLQQASLDRERLEKYLDAVRELSISDPEQLKAHTTLLARSLNMRVEQQCFDKPSLQQASCLTQNTDQLVLDDTHSQNMVASLTTGTNTDLVAQISATPTAHAGYYSPYIGAVVDLAHILGTTHSAQYQYIPALSLPKKDDLNLRLNNPPSFRNPKSVLVIGLPPIHPPVAPPLRALDANQVFCLQKPGLVLPADGAPLAFGTELAHNFMLHVDTKTGPGIDLPAKADPVLGGFVIEIEAAQGAELANYATGILRGIWGFKAFDGPRYHLRTSRPGQWVVASKDASALIIGREDTLHLQSPDACCVSSVLLRDEKGKTVETEWKNAKPDELEIKVPLQNATAGSVIMSVKKFGLHEADEIPLHTYAEAGRLDGFDMHAGDEEGVLRGTRLDQVTMVEVDGLRFDPETLTRANQHDELKVVTHDDSASTKLLPAQPIAVRVTLQDGRFLTVNAFMREPRPKVTLLNKSVQYDPNASASQVRMGNQDELPQDARLNFFLKTQVPENFPATEHIEVTTADESFRVQLSFKDGNLTMQDSKTVYAVLDPMKLLGPSAFGPLKFRAVSGDGIEGDWQPLINLVRFPVITGVHCVTSPEKQCMLYGDKLFLIDAVSTDPDFANPVTVPDGFVEASLIIPFPKGKTIYLKLRDDPATVDSAVVPVSTTQ